MKILAVYSIKGGVGKTATAVNLAYLSALEGARTLVWDLDPQGAASFYFRIRPEIEGGGKRLIRRPRAVRRHIRGTDYGLLDLLPSDYSYRHLDLFLDRLKRPNKRLLRQLASEYDHLFIDCAPGVSLTSEVIFVAADALVVPTIPTTLSLRTLAQLRTHVAQMGRRRPLVLPFFCMVDLRKSMHREICDPVAGHGPDVLGAQIPYASVVEKMGQKRAPVEVFAPGTAAAHGYRRLWNHVRSRLDRQRDDRP